jgi:hypothetical protein
MQTFLDFVRVTTDPASAKYVPPAERIASFDNDGTLWCEHPMYFQLLFALDRVKALASKHPDWKGKEVAKVAGDWIFLPRPIGGVAAFTEIL